MKRRLIAALAACVFSAAAGAGGADVHYYYYDLATHQATPAGGIAWSPEAAWDNSGFTNAFTPRLANIRTLDWGDVKRDTHVLMFQIGYATNSTTPITIDVEFYGGDDGWNSTGRVLLESFSLTGLPVSTTPGQIQHFAVDIDLRAARRTFVIDGPDLDGDNRTDFSYTYRMRGRGNATLDGMGPAFGGLGPLTPPGAPGRENLFDRFREVPTGSNNWVYEGTFRFSGPTDPYTQYHMRLYQSPPGIESEQVFEPVGPPDLP